MEEGDLVVVGNLSLLRDALLVTREEDITDDESDPDAAE